MEVYEFSLAIPLPDEPFAKGRVLGNIETLAGSFVAALARAKFDGVELQHGMKARRGEYGKRKPNVVPPEPVSTAPVNTAPMPFCRVIHDDDTGAALAIPMGSYHD